jgi:hypothetical protein
MVFLQGRRISLGQIQLRFHADARPLRGQKDRSPGVPDSVCNRDSVPSSARMHAPLAVAGGSIHPARSPQRHQPVLRVVHARSGYPLTIAAA